MTIGPEDPIGQRLGSERLYEQRYDEVAAPPPPPEAPPTPPPSNVRQMARPRGKARRERPAKQPPAPPPVRADTAPPAEQEPRNWADPVSTALELAGIIAITAGCALIAPYLALIVGGALLALLGVAIGWNAAE